MVGKITVQSGSAGSEDALWAEGGEDEECGKGVEEKPEETEEGKSDAARRRRTEHLVFTRAGLEATLSEMTRCWPCVRRAVPWACSSSLLSSSECGWLLPLVTVLARLLDRTPVPERSITEGMSATYSAHAPRAQ